ncbi:MAG: 2-C-methyl-D-erythritol 4-phosphate cytidylyltransferase [Planctomycetaceae bacterium]|nr:2-C-methyl-D-erythritol 4-phosphate cytidylyltransferase [Planctomycetales bacterium]MCB9875345.1 2-C-methyl-D-erythritol 4-phosphate cytidylyltransferase [Planctomycetaceae bacterium]MCB9936695.1 2-C-methyl-D-erythritol 4-phosphate cytidylyltransferase [Planctomycetaceae bacterium]
MATFAVILPAAGKSSRFHDKHYKKPFIALGERAVWLHAADKFLNRDDVKQVILIISPEDREDFHMRFGANVAIMGIDVVEGGAERSDSVRNALARVHDEIDFVAVHDAARPCIASEWIDAVFDAAKETGAAILGVPVSSTLKRVAANNTIEATVPRANVWEAQTPQVFRRDWLVEAYAKADKTPATDDAELIQRLGHAVKVVPGSPINLKITTKDDLRLAAQALKALPKPKLEGPTHPFAGDDMWR